MLYRVSQHPVPPAPIHKVVYSHVAYVRPAPTSRTEVNSPVYSVRLVRVVWCLEVWEHWVARVSTAV